MKNFFQNYAGTIAGTLSVLVIALGFIFYQSDETLSNWDDIDVVRTVIVEGQLVESLDDFHKSFVLIRGKTVLKVIVPIGTSLRGYSSDSTTITLIVTNTPAMGPYLAKVTVPTSLLNQLL